MKEVKPKYFFLENVASMSKDNKKEIDELLGVEGFLINSAQFSAQIRKRYYWTNIPFDKEITGTGVDLSEILESGFVSRKKSVCVSRRYWAAVQSSNNKEVVRMINKRAKKSFMSIVYEEEGNPESARVFTRRELERLQTVPEGYTDCVSYKDAVDLLGDGWTVKVIEYIFKGLKNEHEI